VSRMRLVPLALLFIGLSFTAHATDAPSPALAHLPAPTIAIIDVQRILEESFAAKSVQKQLETQRTKFQDETESEENGLRSEEDALGKTREQAAPDSVESVKEQQLRQKMLVVERHVEARRKLLDQAFTDSMNDVRKTLLEVVESVARAHGANLVLVKQQALWVDAPLDITDEVLKLLNQKLPQLNVNIAPETKP
jgi:outer membrane protein